MNKHADIIVAGGGVIGMMAAWRLQKAGFATLVLDSGGPAATNAAAGMLAPSFEKALHHAGEALSAFSGESLKRWRTTARELEAACGAAIDFDDSGILSVAFSDDEAGELRADHGGGRILQRKTALELEPGLSPSIVSARLAAGEGQVDPRKALAALGEAFRREGGRVRRGAAVAGVVASKALGVALRSGERLYAEKIVIATGARIAGVARLPKGALFPVKGEALAITNNRFGPRRVIRTRRAYLCPKSDGRVVIGATEIPGDWTITTHAPRIGDLRKGADAAFRSLVPAVEVERWAGLRPATRDGAPVIGPAPDGPAGVFYALGHYRNGVLLAPATADAIAEWAKTGAAPSSVAAFSAARFKDLGVC